MRFDFIVIVPLLPSCYGFFFVIRHRVSCFGGFQCPHVNDCSTDRSNSGALQEEVGEILGEEKESWEEVLVAAGMFYTVKPEILHLSGGNRGKYLKLDGQYVLQWEMINKARREGYKRYNFYGIAEKIYEKPEGYGVYEFKRGFGGKVEELLGEYVLPVSWVEKIRN